MLYALSGAVQVSQCIAYSNRTSSEMIGLPKSKEKSMRLDDIRSRPALTVKEVLDVLPIGRTALYAAISAGEVPSVRIGTRIMVPTAPLLRMFGIEDEGDGV